MHIYYRIGAASQHAPDSDLENSSSESAGQKRPFCERNDAGTPGTLGTVEAPLVYHSPSHTPQTTTTTPSTTTSPYDLDTVVSTYKAKRGPAARKPIRSLDTDQKLSTPQLLKFQPRRSWKRLRPNERLAVIAKTVLLSEAYAWTLNLDHAKIAALSTPGVDPVKRLSDEINRLLKRHFGRALETAFTFEFDADERLHVHGFTILPDHAPETTAKLKLILKQAGGVIHGAAAGWQVEGRPMRSNGWQEYLEKDSERTAELLGTDKIDYSSRTITRLAKEAHAADLARWRAAKNRKASETATEDSGESSAASESSDTIPALDDSQRPSMAVSFDKQLADLVLGMERSLSQRQLAEIEALERALE